MAAAVDVARRLRAARVLAGLETREELAERINLPKLGAKTLGKIERGERTLEEHEIPPIADALGLPVSFFTNGLEVADEGQLDRLEQKVDACLELLKRLVMADVPAPEADLAHALEGSPPTAPTDQPEPRPAAAGAQRRTG